MAARAVGAVASLGLRIWWRATGRPIDSIAILGASAATIVIVVNAAFLQAGPHPAPFFANPAPPAAVTAEARPKPAESIAPKPVEQATAKPVDSAATHTAAATRAPQAVPVRRNDPIAELIGPSSRIMAVQRVLSEFGYGQIRQTGTLDGATSEAIEKFEREHKLPVSGRVSDRLVSELTVMTGHPVE
jgi:hypothetical protein